MYKNLVATGEMVDVERESILVKFTVMNVKCGSLEKAHNVFDRLQIRDVQARNTLFSTLKACGSIRSFGYRLC